MIFIASSQDLVENKFDLSKCHMIVIQVADWTHSEKQSPQGMAYQHPIVHLNIRLPRVGSEKNKRINTNPVWKLLVQYLWFWNARNILSPQWGDLKVQTYAELKMYWIILGSIRHVKLTLLFLPLKCDYKNTNLYTSYTSFLLGSFT